MAPKGRKRIGLRRQDAARDRMKEFGFDKRVINESIKQVLKVYGEDQWFLIEDANYDALLNICLEKKEEQDNQLAAEEHKETAQEEEEEEEKKADALLITNEAVMNSSPPAFQFVEAPVDFAHQSVGGAHSSHCGWLSSEEETDPDEDEDSDEMIELTPEPLCEELEELLREVYGQKKMKYN